MGKEKGIVVFVTVPLKEAEKLVKILLKERVCACINIIENVKSISGGKRRFVKKEKLY